ncbi:MAG: GIY-YIG nuclease family protein [Candidatus Cloacimonadota bacterium]|nr:MAG: GIY-YIG nuclease family protein [Candidatus Cloacimonadota bacterium]
MRCSYVYILSDVNNRILYTGVISNLLKSVWEHKNHIVDGFTKRYNVTKLVYYEEGENINSAISREKQTKGKLRKKKIVLIEKSNPEWRDLYLDLVNEKPMSL